MAIFREMEKKIPKIYIEPPKISYIQNDLKQVEQCWRHHTFWFSTYYKDELKIMVLAFKKKKRHRSVNIMESIDKLTHTWSVNFKQMSQGCTTGNW